MRTRALYATWTLAVLVALSGFVPATRFASTASTAPPAPADRGITAHAVPAALSAILTSAAHAQQSVDVREWQVPWEETRPRDPYVGPDGRVWFVGQRADYAAYLEPGTGEFTRFDLPEGAGPHNLIVADNGTVWYAGNRDMHIGRIDPESGEITKFEMPTPDARDPHTLIWHGHRIFFTLQGANMLGRMDTVTKEIELVDVPTPRARPYGINKAPDGTIWVVELGSNKLIRMDPETLALQEIELPREDARPRRMEVTSDGRVWYVDYAQGYLGAYDPATGEFDEWRAPRAAESRPYGMEVDDRDRLWFVETGPRGEPNQFVGFDPATEEFFTTAQVPSGGGTVRHMYYHAPTNTVWFGADTNTIGRARLP